MRSLIFVAGVIFAVQAGAIVVESPYNRKLDLTPIESILKSPKADLVKTIKATGVDVYLLPSKNAKQPIAGFLKDVPRLSEERFKKMNLDDLHLSGSEGIFIPATDPCCSLSRDSILVSDDVDAITMIHEFAHAVFYSQLSKEDKLSHITAEQEVINAVRVFKFRLDAVVRNVSNIRNPLWRRDLMNAMIDYVQAADKIVRFNLSEEVIIERSLQNLIKPDSKYYNRQRMEQGEKYALARLEEIRIIVSDLAFASDWSQGEIKVLEDTLEMREKYQLEKQYKELNANIKIFADKHAKLKEFKLL